MSPTRLEDAVISVRIETGRARSELHSLKSDIGDMDERQRVVRSRAAEAGGADMPGMPSRSGPRRKTPGESGDSGDGKNAGTREGSPGELKDPLRFLQTVRHLQNLVSAKSGREILAETGHLMQQMPGSFGHRAGWLARAVAAAPDVMIGMAEYWQWLNVSGHIVQAKGASIDAHGGGKKGMAAWKDIEKRANDKGEWFGEGNLQRDFARQMRGVDDRIARLVSLDEAFAETKAMTGATALAGKAYEWKEFQSHFNRFNEHAEFLYKLNRRTKRNLQMQSAMGAWNQTLGGFGGMWDAAGWFLGEFKSRF